MTNNAVPYHAIYLSKCKPKARSLIEVCRQHYGALLLPCTFTAGNACSNLSMGSYWAGNLSRVPSSDGSSSTVKPGLWVAISNRTPPLAAKAQQRDRNFGDAHCARTGYSTLRQPMDAIGQAACAKLFQQIERKAPCQSTVIKLKLIIRESWGAKRLHLLKLLS